MARKTFLDPVKGLFRAACRRRSARKLTAARPNPVCPPAAFEALESRALMAATPGAFPQIGVNLDAITYYSSAWTFTDAFKQSAPFTATAVDTVTGESGKWGQGGDVSVDANGWPTELKTWTDEATGHRMKQRLDTLIFRDIDGQYPSGVYHLAWEGTGEISFGPGAQIVSRNGKTAEVSVDSSHNGIVLHIDDMSASDPVRNIRLWMPDYNGQSFKGQVWAPGAPFSPFHPRFLEIAAPFKTLRFMPWMRINGNVLETWDERRTIDAQTQMAGDKRGIAFEYMVELANELDADAWVNMPHMADDEFVENFAEMFDAGLEPGRKVYVEWSNEIWNTAGGFGTWRWLDTLTKLPENAGKGEYELAAREMKRDFDIWNDVFADDSRIVRVVAGQSANRYVLEEQAKYLVEQGGTFDAMSVAGYIGINDASAFNANTTAEEVANRVLAGVPNTLGSMARAKALADEYAALLGKDIQFVTYEGGQSLDAGNAPYKQAYYDAQVHPVMYEAYQDLMQGFHDLGGDLFMHFTLVSQNQPSGSWGALQLMTQTPETAPKYRALLDAASGAIYRPKVRVEALQPVATERGGVAALFRVTRMGDRSGALEVAYTVSGTAAAGSDYPALSGVVSFAPGETSKLIEIAPADDGELEDGESVTLAVTAAAGAYDVDRLRAAAGVTVADDDGYTFDDLNVRNPSFESGSLEHWRLESRSGIEAITQAVNSSPAAPHDGTHFAWSGGANGRSGGGDKRFDLVQRANLGHAANVDARGARLTVSGWGAGGGRGLDAAYVEVRFYDKAADAEGATQVGATYVSNRVTSEGEWARMMVDAEVPGGARSVEIRLVGERRGGDTAMNVGFDDVRATLRLPVGDRPRPPAPPPTPDDNDDVGNPPIAGDTTVIKEGTTYTITGAGSVGGTADALHFAYQARTGNFDIRVKVSSITNAADASGASMAGLMARSSLLADAPNVFAKAYAQNDPQGFGLSFRKRGGKPSKAVGRGEVSFPDAWVRLRRVKNTFTAYRSADGVTWVKVGTAKVNIGPTVLFGLAAASQSSSATTTASFDVLSDVTEAYVQVGKRRIYQPIPHPRGLGRAPEPISSATIALPRETGGRGNGNGGRGNGGNGGGASFNGVRPDWAKMVKPYHRS